MRKHIAPIKVCVSTLQVLAEGRVLARTPGTPRRYAAQRRATLIGIRCRLTRSG